MTVDSMTTADPAADAGMDEKAKPGKQDSTEKKEKPPKQAWRYFLSLVRYSPWIYSGLIGLRILIFGIFPQITGLVQREFFNTLSGSASLGLNPQTIAAIVIGFALAQAVTI